MGMRSPWISDMKRTAVSLAAMLVMLAGCGGPKLLPVSGVVTLDGQPVAEAGVMFLPVEKGQATGGTTDATGKFELATTNRIGVAPGQYRVTVTKREVAGRGMFDTTQSKSPKVQWLVPEKYGNVSTSGLEATVSAENRQFTFALTSR